MLKRKEKIIAMIPARMGSSRLKKKNLALIDGRAMVSFTLEAAIKSQVFDEVYLNADDSFFEGMAKEWGAKFYLRPKDLGGGQIKSDHVVLDFMRQFPADITVWANSVSPLQTGPEIKSVVDFFVQENLDSLITSYKEQVHCMYQNRPLNFSFDGLFAQTQDLEPVERFVYSVMMWRNKSFIEHMEKDNHALMCGRFKTFPVSKASALVVKTAEDFKLVEAIIKGQKQQQEIAYADEVQL